MRDASRNDWKLERLIAVLLSLLFLLPFVATASPGGAPALYLSQPDSGELIPAVTVSTDVHMEVSGSLARGSLRQVFLNATPDSVEGMYVLPLASQAAVDTFTMHVDGRSVEAEIQEIDTTRTQYLSADEDDPAVSIIRQLRANGFRIAIATILPGQEVIFEIVWQQPVDLTPSGASLSVPLPVAPTFRPALQVARVPVPEDSAAPALLLAGSEDGPSLHVQVDVESGASLRSPSHPDSRVETTPRGRRRIRMGEPASAHEFTVRWDLLTRKEMGTELPRNS